MEGVDYKAPAAAAKLEYNGKEQELIAAGAATIGIMQYKLGENGTWGTDIPTATNAGSYGVYYRVVGSNNYNNTEAQKITCEIENGPLPFPTNRRAAIKQLICTAISYLSRGNHILI